MMGWTRGSDRIPNSEFVSSAEHFLGSEHFERREGEGKHFENWPGSRQGLTALLLCRILPFALSCRIG
jgi:hypothetical protein